MERGRLEAEAVERAMGNLRVVEDLRVPGGCQLVIEAIVENLEAKQALFRQLEEVVGDEAILASNTSSLSVTAIASACRDPGRVAGLHFFNPVPLMRLVEVIDGLATRTGIAERLCALVATFGHQAVRATDSPGFIVNHAGRAFGTEALRILGEGVAPVAAIDEVLREGAGFRMGPFELFDLVGLDVSLPVMESIYRQYYEEPRYRPHPLLRQMLAAGRLGRKSGQGFYRYDGAGQVPAAAPAVAPGAALPPVWLGVDDEHDRAPLLTLLQRLGAEVESGERPSGAALCLLAPLGADVSAAARRFAVDPTRSLAIDVLSDLERHRCLMACPATRAELQQAARTLFARDGVGVTLIRDSAGFIVQRTLASIVSPRQQIGAPRGIAQRPGRRAAAHPRTPACAQRRPALSPQSLVAPARPTGPFPAPAGQPVGLLIPSRRNTPCSMPISTPACVRLSAGMPVHSRRCVRTTWPACCWRVSRKPPGSPSTTWRM